MRCTTRPSLASLAAAAASLLAPACSSALKGAPASIREEVLRYPGLGRIKWRLPQIPDVRFSVAAPLLSAGPRIECGFPSSGKCKIEAYARDLSKHARAKRADFLDEMQDFTLRFGKERTIDIKTRGSGPALYYATLTHKYPERNNARITRGYYIKGPFVIRFEHESRADFAAELEPIFEVVLSAEALDADAILAWKLYDYKAICSQAFPALQDGNDAAFAGSPFASVDWFSGILASRENTSRDQLADELANQSKDLFDSFAKKRTFQYFWHFCQVYPATVLEAERYRSAGRRRGTIGVNPGARDATELGAGVPVASVSKDGPAARAGVRSGDIILRVNGEEVSTVTDLLRATVLQTGKEVELRILRGSEALHLVVGVAAEPD